MENNIWIFWIAIFFVFWFFIIRPKINAQKKENAFREGLKKGDRVITIGGIHGKIIGIKEMFVLLEIEAGTNIKVEKTAILKTKNET